MSGANQTLLIDADEYLFRATSVCEREVRWDEENHVLSCNRRESWDNFTRMLDQWRTRFDTDDIVLVFSGARPYFREHLYPEYKGGRSARKPLCYKDLKDECAKHYVVRSHPTLEADDVMGILATKPGSTSIIVSQDKDMETVPARWVKGINEEVQTISHERANRFHLFQTLTGDKTDGYSGCPGMGPAKAGRWLDSDTGVGLPGSWERVLDAYRREDLEDSEALLQARLSKILTWDLWDSARKEPILWTP